MQNIAVFRQVFEDAGLPPHVIDGIIANYVFESGGQTDINTRENTGDGGRARGAAQWQGDRWSGPNGLLAFANARGTDWTDPETQALFTVFELQGPEASTYQRLLTAPDAAAATEIFMTGFERPGTPHLDGRLQALGYVTGGPTPAFTTPQQPGSATPATGNQQMPDRPIISRMAENWRSRAEGGTPILDRMRDRQQRRAAGERPIMAGIARFLENLASRPREGTETGTGTTPGILGPGMNMTSWRTPNPGGSGAPGVAPTSQMSAQERLQALLTGPHAEAVRTAIAGAIGTQPGGPPPVMPITSPAMPVQWPPQQGPQQPPDQPPAQPDWNPWAMLSQPPQANLSPPQPMPGPEEFYNTLGNVAPVTPALGPFAPSPLRPPTVPGAPMSGARRFPPRFTPAPFLPMAGMGGLLRG